MDPATALPLCDAGCDAMSNLLVSGIATSVSADLRRLLVGMLDPNPVSRMTLADIVAHPWLADGSAAV